MQECCATNPINLKGEIKVIFKLNRFNAIIGAMWPNNPIKVDKIALTIQSWLNKILKKKHNQFIP
jgi:hypothetical protein